MMWGPSLKLPPMKQLTCDKLIESSVCTKMHSLKKPGTWKTHWIDIGPHQLVALHNHVERGCYRMGCDKLMRSNIVYPGTAFLVLNA